MTQVAVVGGGPAGLSAALFTQKNGLETVVFDTDKTWLHKAHLFNYPGVGSQDGTVFLENLRSQVDAFGVERRQGNPVTEVARSGDRLVITTEEEEVEADYVVLATGINRDLADDLGCEFDGELVDVDLSMETSVEGVYATGAMVRDGQWEVVISAGDGAAAALSILSEEKGEPVHDFDTPADARKLFQTDD